MIPQFQDKKDKSYYLPTSVTGPEGRIPIAGKNYGGDTRIKSFKEFAGEYRKGSNKYGKLVSRIMEFLRLPEFKNEIDENNELQLKVSDFQKQSHINIDKIKQLLNDDHNLYNFDIQIDDEYITFSNFKKPKNGKWFEM
jgi:hypothetical protein